MATKTQPSREKKSDQAELEALVERAMSEPGVAEVVEVYEKTERIVAAAPVPDDFTTVASTTSRPRR